MSSLSSSTIVLSTLDALLHQSGSPFADVVFACKDGRTGAHRAIIEARSGILRRSSSSSDNDNSTTTTVVLLPDVSVVRVREMLQILYTGEVKVNGLGDLDDLRWLCRSLEIRIDFQVNQVVVDAPAAADNVDDHEVLEDSNDDDDDFNPVIVNTVSVADGERIAAVKTQSSSDEEELSNDGSDSTWHDEEDPEDEDVDIESMDEGDFEDEDPIQGAEASSGNAETGQKKTEEGSRKKRKLEMQRLSCPTCSKSFSKVSRVMQHLARSHLKEQVISNMVDGKKCKLCGYTSPESGNVVRHVGTVHGEEVKRFADPKQMKWIEKFWKSNKGRKTIVAVQKVYIKCPSCPKSFSKVSEVLRHLATSHLKDQIRANMIVDERKCKFCGYMGSDLHSVIRHVGVAHGGVEKFADQQQLEWIEKTKKK